MVRLAGQLPGARTRWPITVANLSGQVVAIPCRGVVQNVGMAQPRLARLMIALGAMGALLAGPIHPASAADGLRLPEVIRPPGTWSNEEGVVGPVAAIGIADRTRPVGIFDSRSNVSLFVVSAEDGTARWVKLPGFSFERWGFVGGVAVSPDGRWLGWVRPLRARPRFPYSRVAGWSVMDTTTGDIRKLNVDGFSEVRGTGGDLMFSGDSRYLLTTYAPPDTPLEGRSKAHQLVAWDVASGEPTVVEPPGHYWLPFLGRAPNGIVWSRGNRVFRFEPETGERSTLSLEVGTPFVSWSPDGSKIAYHGTDPDEESVDHRLFVISPADNEPLSFDLPATSPLGPVAWRDSTHVVVENYRRAVYVVDITDGSVETVEYDEAGATLNTPYVATDLWQQPLGPAPQQSGQTDPRRPWRWAAGAGAALGAALLLLRLRHRRKAPAAP